MGLVGFFYLSLQFEGEGREIYSAKWLSQSWCQAGPGTVPFISCMVIPAVSIEVPGAIRGAAIKCYFVHNEKYYFFFLPVNFSHYWAEQNGWRFLLKLFLLLYNFDSGIKWVFTGSAEPSGACWVLNGVLCSVTSNNNWRLLIWALPVVLLVTVSFLLSSFESCTFLPSAL